MGKKETVEILGVNISVITLPDMLQFVLSSIKSKSKIIVSYVNIHGLNLAFNDELFRSCLHKSDITFCDGFGVKIAVKLIAGVSLHRFTPPDWFDLLAEKCAEQNYTIFFLGTQLAIVEKAAKILSVRFPDLKIVGVHDGYFDKAKGSVENQKVIQKINSEKPDILVVGFGMPSQEKWISENFNELQTHVILPVGAFFDYLAGETKRAPRWMTDHGFEWLGRLVIEPSRLWKRYLIGNPLFFWRIFKHHILKIQLPFRNCVE